jgi:uncharacterized membrane protein (UPF0127 family)
MPVLCRLSYSSDVRMIRPMLPPRPVRVLLSIAIVSVACASEAPPDDTGDGGLARGTLVIETDGGEVPISVEIAETPEQKARGLMGRTFLPPNAGMVFLEQEPTTTGFWMKDTLIPLSIAFWGQDRRIFRILDMEPCGTDDCPTYEPRGEWVGAAEVNQGFFEERGVQTGDRVRLLR